MPKTRGQPLREQTHWPDVIRDADAGLPILKSRGDKAAEALARLIPELPDDVIQEVAWEIGLDLCIAYTADGKGFDFNLTDLQLVAFTAAIAAEAEVRRSAGIA